MARRDVSMPWATTSGPCAPPYIHLDGNDRTGAVDTGENLTSNLDHQHECRRILVFVSIYEGASPSPVCTPR
jgi:uncharacterized protein involved in tellurium resistance